MRPYRGLLLLLALATLGAVGWHLLADDPGYLLLTFRGWSVETTLVVAVVAMLFGLAALYATVGLLRAPWRWWRRGRRRAARERLGAGLLALHEGRWLRAEKDLRRAASERELRIPALLQASLAARERGAEAQSDALLEEAARAGAPVAAVLPALQRLLAEGRAATACEVLAGVAQDGPLPPRALELQARALAACGRSDEAVAMLPALRREKVREGDGWLALEHALLPPWLLAADSRGDLDRRWSSLERGQRLQAPLVDAYAARADALGASGDAALAIERALAKGEFAPSLVSRYGLLHHPDLGAALKTAEAWLAAHPDDAEVLLCLGRLCRADQLWGKAEAYLGRALAQGIGAPAWETLAEVFAEQGDDARARQAYANGGATRRGLPVRPVLRLARSGDDPAVAEERSSMGLPRLPPARGSQG